MYVYEILHMKSVRKILIQITKSRIYIILFNYTQKHSIRVPNVGYNLLTHKN